jgi:hypothetical protein
MVVPSQGRLQAAGTFTLPGNCVTIGKERPGSGQRVSLQQKRKEKDMRQLSLLVFVSYVSLFAASVAAAQDYRTIAVQEGVEVMAAIAPFGPNNTITAHLKFVNKNGYKVNITWSPLITCEKGPAKKGYGAPFSMEAGASYELSLWRSSTCSMGSIKELTVDMEVKKADLY